jgi:copper homeostasis protein
MQRYFLEIACFNIESALIAQEAGADRIELCENLSLGGITPQIDLIEQAKIKLSIPLFVMIRPRGGNFVYSPEEFLAMKESIIQIKRLNVGGFVFGILNEDGTVNKKQNTELLKLAHPLSCTFHRAFDRVKDPLSALSDIADCGFNAILTSGQSSNALEGIDNLKVLADQAGNKIVIMPGGGVRSANISILKEKIVTRYFHSSGITGNKDMADGNEIKSLKEKLS